MKSLTVQLKASFEAQRHDIAAKIGAIPGILSAQPNEDGLRVRVAYTNSNVPLEIKKIPGVFEMFQTGSAAKSLPFANRPLG